VLSTVNISPALKPLTNSISCFRRAIVWWNSLLRWPLDDAASSRLRADSSILRSWSQVSCGDHVSIAMKKNCDLGLSEMTLPAFASLPMGEIRW